jgi:branched-chain amino acid transport system permease protein
MLVSLILGSLMIGSVYGMLALGYSLIYSASGLMTFCQGQFLMLGAFLGLTFYKLMKLPFILAFVLTVLIMFALGLIVEKFLIRILLNKGATSIYIVLSTIAISIILPNFAQAVWGSQTLQMPSIFHVTTVKILGASVQPESLLVMAVGFASMLLLHLFMTKSRFGISMRAAAMDPLAASSLGINVNFTTGLTWAIAAALAGGIGALLGPVYGVSTGMGDIIGTKGFAGAVIGGYGNMYGAIVGSLLLGFIETFVAGYVTTTYKDFVSFFILIIVMIVLPRGLFKAKVYEAD